MSKAVYDALGIDEEDAGHLEAIRLLESEAVAQKSPFGESAPENPRSEQLRQSASPQAKCAIETLLVVANTLDVVEAMFDEERGDGFGVTHVNEYDVCARGLNLVALPTQIRERLTAEGTTGVPQEDEQDGRTRAQLEEKRTGAGAHGFQGLNDFLQVFSGHGGCGHWALRDYLGITTVSIT